MATKKIKPGRGRKGQINAEVETNLIAAFQNGLNVTEACGLSGVELRAFYRKYQKDDIFRRKMDYAKRFLHIKSKQNIAKKISEENDLDTSKWFLHKRDEDYQDDGINVSQEVNVNGEKLEKLVLNIRDNMKKEIDYLKNNERRT